MQFGIREICDVVFKAKNHGYLGSMEVVPGQPVLYIDSAKTSTMEGAATTVYAQGGRGNARLIAWEGEKTLTFTVEDALLSEVGFAILSGAGLIKADGEKNKVYSHRTSTAYVSNGAIDLTDALGAEEVISATSPVFIMTVENGSFTGVLQGTVADEAKGLTVTTEGIKNGTVVFVDYYVEKTEGVTEMTIDAENFAGYYYVEAATLFRRQSDGKDLPAELIFPNVKIQSNFTFSMASTGDPSTFTFTMDAMPGYTRFNRAKKALCVLQVIDEETEGPEPSDSGYDDSVGNEADMDDLYPILGE